MMKILCLGEALIDMICTDKGSPLHDGVNFVKKSGGAPTNVAAAIAALGGLVSLSAKVGRDPFGKHLIDILQTFGVDSRYILEDKDHFTTFAFVALMANGERDFYFNRGADGYLNKAEVDELPVNEYGVVHFGSATAFLAGDLNEAYHHLLELSLHRNRFISFDPNYRQLLFGDKPGRFKQQSWEFIAACNFLKVSDEEATLLTGHADMTEAIQAFRQRTSAVVAITMGKEGTLLGHPEGIFVVPSIAITPVDTTGAGDAFVGAVLYQVSQLLETKSLLTLAEWQNIIYQANKAGARTCEYLGAMEAFKHLHAGIFSN